ncbi:hypothetical protein Ancab_000731 [Ancistrocladus abbreviatus]
MMSLNMDSVRLDDADNSIEETFSRELLSLDSLDTSGIYGEPLVHPRVGNEYQVEIPPMLTESEHLRLSTNPVECEVIDASHPFLLGLPVPVMWVYSEAKTVKDEGAEILNDPANGACPNWFLEFKSINKRGSYVNEREPKSKVHTVNTGFCPFPGLSADSWSDFEVDCFLLGLFIFGKNLLQVSRFMESKDMGQILSFYYGRFYRSPGYCRWSDCRKMRNKKCVHGQKIFTGCRQQEFLSRLLPHLLEESKNTLPEVSKAFAEGRISLEDYVSTLKGMVGMDTLINAVGIGRKDDLTTLILESKSSHISRSEIPSGKACSSLTCADIIKFLTGDFRLSKARSNDLFWEAVWPRLLAKGWHSEQPKNEGYTGSKNCLVFLIPGVKKFSRRKLVKGDHYFDCVSDVLNKVASEPELLELEAGETRACEPENGWAAEVNTDDGGVGAPNCERHCYLKPRVFPSSANFMKFTVVDTSLVLGEKMSKVRELRSLPAEARRSVLLKSRSRHTEGIFPRDSIMDPRISDIPLNSQHLANGSLGNQRMPNDSSEHAEKLVEDRGNHNTSLSIDQQSRTIKHQFSRRAKAGPSNPSGPNSKRRRLTACSKDNVGCNMENFPGSSVVGKVESCCVLSSATSEMDVASEVDHSLKKLLPIKSSAGGCLQEKSQNCADLEISQECDEKPVARHYIDLNLPQVLTEPVTSGKIKMEAEDDHSNWNKPLESSEAARVPHNDGVSEKQPALSGRRQSTRNRPLTTKALEALEIGLLSPRQNRKRQPASTQGHQSRPSSRLCVRSAISANCSDADVTKSKHVGYTGAHNGLTETLGSTHFHTKKEAAHELF